MIYLHALTFALAASVFAVCLVLFLIERCAVAVPEGSTHD